MQLTDAIRRRRSTSPVTDSAPSDAELLALAGVAAHSPDHAGLRPWRLVTVRGSDRNRLGAVLAAGFGDEPGSAAAVKTAAKTLRAPLLLAVIGCPVEHATVPAWEQIAAVGAFVATLQLVLFEAGYTAMWRTGPPSTVPAVRELHGLAESELMLGWLYVGGVSNSSSGVVEADPDVSGKLSALPPA